MGMVLGWTGVAIAYILMQTAVNVWAALMLPNVVDRARQRIEKRPFACFFAGLGIYVVFGVAAAVLFQVPQGFFAGFVLLGPLFASAILGGAAFTRMLAERMSPIGGSSMLRNLVGAALTTTLATLLPVIGWFMVLPVLGFISIGAGFMAWVSKRELAREVVAPAPQVTYAGPTHAGWAGYELQASVVPATPSAPQPQAAAVAWSAQPEQPVG